MEEATDNEKRRMRKKTIIVKKRKFLVDSLGRKELIISQLLRVCDL
jgi:hypothetical protein